MANLTVSISGETYSFLIDNTKAEFYVRKGESMKFYKRKTKIDFQ